MLADAVAPLASLPGVAEVRSVGLLAAVELQAEVLGARAGLLEEVVRAARRNGIVTRALRGVGVQISPPYVVDEDDLRAIATGIGAAVEAVCGPVAAAR